MTILDIPHLILSSLIVFLFMYMYIGHVLVKLHIILCNC